MPQIGTGRAAPWADRRAETSKARRQVTVEATSWSGAFEAAMRAALWGWTLARRRSACEAACRRSDAIAKRQNEEQKKSELFARHQHGVTEPLSISMDIDRRSAGDGNRLHGEVPRRRRSCQ